MTLQGDPANAAALRTGAPGGRPTGRQANPLRRRTAVVIVTTVMAMVAGLVFVAVSAEGRELSRTSSNDGGAWLVNRELGVVGHKNRSVGELSSFMQVSDSPEADIYQADGVVVVHDATANQLHEVDSRSFSEDFDPTELPPGSRVVAVDEAVIVYRSDPFAFWHIDAIDLPSVSNLDAVAPEFSLEGAAHLAASPDGTVAIVDHQGRQLYWFSSDGDAAEPIQLGSVGNVGDLTIVDASAVVLSESGDVTVVGPSDVDHRLSWGDDAADIAPIVALQQPSRMMASSATPLARHVFGLSQTGDIIEINLLTDPVQVGTRATIAGENPLAPIVHDGCVYGVVTQPPTLGISCATFESRSLDGAGQDLRLRLVNGWVWVNDVRDGGTWVWNEDNTVDELDDWGLAVNALNEEDDEQVTTTTLSPTTEQTLVEDPDAEGSVQDSDSYDATEINVPPVAYPDETRTRSDRAVVIDVLDNDTDANNDILVITDATLTSGDAIISIAPARDEIQVTPLPGFVGLVQFDYSISDGRSDPVSTFVTVEVVDPASTNAPPTATTDVVATAPGHSTTIDVLLNDFDPDGDAIALLSISAETGTLRWSPNGQVTFTPDSTTVAGWLELPYVVTDDLGATSPGLLRVEIRDRGANQEPDARNDQATTVVRRPITFNILANDSDPDGDTLVVGSRPQLISPEGATVRTSVSSDGEFTFVADSPGTYIFTYTVTDASSGGSERDTARIRVDVEPADANEPPIAVRDDVVVPVGEARLVYVLDNDGDPDGDVIGVVDWQSSPGIEIREHVDQSGIVGFWVSVGANRPDRPTFTYSISDGVNDPVSAPVVVAIVDRLPQDQPPIARDDVIEVRAGTTVEQIAVLDNDFDPEGGTLRIVGVGQSDRAEVTIAEDEQTLTIAVAPGARSSFSVSYDIEDRGGKRASAVVNVRLIGDDAPNRPPVARADIGRTFADSSTSIDVLINDSDPDGDAIVLEGIVAQPEHGQAIVLDNGVVRYDPDPNFAGTDFIRYAIVDARGDRAVGDVSIGVFARQGQNLPPIANDDTYTLQGPITTPLSVLDNDSDPDGDPIRIVGVSVASAGSVSVDGEGALIFESPERLLEPTTITFRYTIADTAGNQDDATVRITMEAFQLAAPTPTPTAEFELPEPEPTPGATPTPDATPEPLPEATPTPVPEVENQLPVAVSDETAPEREGTQVTVNALANDFDPDGDNAELRIVEVGAGGEIAGSNVRVTVTDQVQQISYTIEDERGGQDSAVITVLVTENRAPTVEPASFATPFETALEIDLSNQATDPDGDALFFVCCDSPRGGSIGNVVADNGVLRVTFTPNNNYSGPAGFAYTVDDQRGHQVAGSVVIDVQAAENQTPVAAGNTVLVPQGESATIDLTQLASDPDEGDTLSWSIIDQNTPVGFTMNLSGSTVTAVVDRTVAVDEQATFTYEVSDGTLSATAVVQVRVIEGANEPPVVRGETVQLEAGASTTVDLSLLTQDNDIGDSLSWSLAGGSYDPLTVDLVGARLQVSAPPTAADSQVAIEYIATDSRSAAASEFISIEVLPPSAADPTAEDDTASTQPGVPIDIAVLDNDIDPLGQGLTLIAASTNQGDASIAGDVVRYAPGDFVGAAVVNYTMRDVANRESSAIVSIDTIGAPDTPAPPSVTATSAEVAITWTEPQSNGSEITGYIVTMYTGNPVVSTTRPFSRDQTSAPWTGLTNGQEYTFTVLAQSAAGDSDESEPSLAVTPDQAPEKPDPPTVAFLDSALDVTWTEPINEGSAITRYELLIGAADVSLPPEEFGPGARNFTWPDLVNGNEYTFQVRAINDAGSSISDPSLPMHPLRAPSAPIIGITERGSDSGALTVNWQAPLDDGGDDITEYRIVSQVGQNTTAGDQRSFDWAALPNGTLITFQVQAYNQAGWGALSTESVGVRPCGVPDTPSFTSLTRGDGQVDIVFDEPGTNGCPITGYTITADNGGGQRTTSNLSVPFDGLTNGTDYRFTIFATNVQGDSTLSAASNPVKPAGPPICPAVAGASATPSGVGEVDVSWNPAADNGEPVTYEINYGGVSQVTSTTNSVTVSSLTNGTTYDFDIRAVNVVGGDDCGSASATTWDLPTPIVTAMVFLPDTDELIVTIAGGDSPLVTVTGDQTTLTNQTTGTVRTSIGDYVGPGAPPDTLTYAITEDGNYRFDIEFCNLVGCRTSTVCCQPITLRSAPGQMDPPAMSFDHPPWDRFGVDVFARFTPPADNGGAAITNYMWEKRWMGASGTLHDDWGNNDLGLDLFVYFYPGYTPVPGSANDGSTILWEVRVAAVNSEGQGEWSEWASITPPLRQPHIQVLQIGSPSRCNAGPWPNDQCSDMWLSGFGLAVNTLYNVSAYTDPGPGDSGHNSTDEFLPNGCGGITVFTDQFGNFASNLGCRFRLNGPVTVTITGGGFGLASETVSFS